MNGKVVAFSIASAVLVGGGGALLLANEHCLAGQFVNGFDATGHIQCTAPGSAPASSSPVDPSCHLSFHHTEGTGQPHVFSIDNIGDASVPISRVGFTFERAGNVTYNSTSGGTFPENLTLPPNASTSGTVLFEGGALAFGDYNHTAGDIVRYHFACADQVIYIAPR